MTRPALSAPAPITAEYDVSGFACEHAELTMWLQRRALANHLAGGSKAYVVACGSEVVGYYALAAGSVEPSVATGALRRNMPKPIPVVVLGRLAVHQDWSGQGVGTGLLKDALARALQVAEIVGIRALLCHAIDEKAKAFYLRHGFVPSPVEPLTVMLGLR